MGNELISVIMCNYNYGIFIGDAIGSVIAQTYKRFELIIVDDGSTDDSRQVIAKFNDSRIRVILQENGGQASAFNAGMNEVSGEIVSFLDSDDWWEVGKLDRIREWFAFLGEKCVVFQHNLAVQAEGQDPVPLRHVLHTGDVAAEMKKRSTLDWLSIPTSGISFRTSALRQVLPIPASFRIAADAYLMRTVPCLGDVYSSPEILGNYRVHGNAVFRNRSFDHMSFNVNALIPALNRFYFDHGIDLCFDERKVVQDKFGPRPSIPKMIESFIHSIFMQMGLWGLLPGIYWLVGRRQRHENLRNIEIRTRREWDTWAGLERKRGQPK